MLNRCAAALREAAESAVTALRAAAARRPAKRVPRRRPFASRRCIDRSSRPASESPSQERRRRARRPERACLFIDTCRRPPALRSAAPCARLPAVADATAPVRCRPRGRASRSSQATRAPHSPTTGKAPLSALQLSRLLSRHALWSDSEAPAALLAGATEVRYDLKLEELPSAPLEAEPPNHQLEVPNPQTIVAPNHQPGST